MKIGLNGYKGKMGKAILACVANTPDMQIDGTYDIDVTPGIDVQFAGAQVIVDFSSKDATFELAAWCAENGKAMVIGTTGHTAEERAQIADFGNKIPIVMAPNFAQGVNALFLLAKKAAELLGPDYEVEIIEAHHRHKKDVPSGTAKKLAEAIKEVRQVQFSDHPHRLQKGGAYITCGREASDSHVRNSSEIAISSLRLGDVFGDHTVIFAGDGERVELTHRASSREAFARGALKAAQWVVDKEPGFYSMAHVLGLDKI